MVGDDIAQAVRAAGRVLETASLRALRGMSPPLVGLSTRSYEELGNASSGIEVPRRRSAAQTMADAPTRVPRVIRVRDRPELWSSFLPRCRRVFRRRLGPGSPGRHAADERRAASRARRPIHVAKPANVELTSCSTAVVNSCGRLRTSEVRMRSSSDSLSSSART
jgi:hypothetical protein